MSFYKVILLLIFLSQLSLAQVQWIVFDSLNSPLIDNKVLSLKHDKNNNIWIGTNYGLFNFDGYFWNLYNTENSGLPSDTVDILVIDTHNNLWFMVNQWNYPYFVKFNGTNWVKSDTNQIIEWCYKREFAVDKNEVKWVSGQKTGGNSGIIRISEDSCVVYSTEIHFPNATDFTIDQNNHFWFSADWATGYTGIAKYSTAWQYYHHWSVGLAIDTVYNEAWFSSLSSIHNIDFDNLTLIAWYPSAYNMWKLFPDKNYCLWIKTLWQGVLKFDRTTAVFTNYDEANSALPSDSVNSIAVDDTNNIWIATVNGLAVFNESGIKLLPSVSNRDTIDFDTVTVHNTLSLSYTVNNPYSADIIVNTIEISSSVFTVNDILPVTIAPGDSIEFNVEFSPDSSIPYKNKLTLKTNKGMKSIYLNGYGKLLSSIDNKAGNPGNFGLSQNYPNPFNPTTRIKYQIPELSRVKLTVYNVLGKEVTTLLNEIKSAGTHEVKFDGADLPSGVYFYRIETANYTDTKKFILLK